VNNDPVGFWLKVVAAALSAVIVLVVVASLGFWYFGIYDTAAGKCNRGDLGACLVYEAQHATPRPVVTFPVFTAPTANVPGPQAFSYWLSVPGHDAMAGVDGEDTISEIKAALPAFSSENTRVVPSNDRLICDVESSTELWKVQIWDSGGADYGTKACHALLALGGSES
jgi:hypothetical protein